MALFHSDYFEKDFSTVKEIKDFIKNYESDGDIPAVYVGTYYKYNCGSIYGAWISFDACYDYEEFEEVCRILHFDEKDPEFMFQDYMCFPSQWYCESFIDEDTFDKIKEYIDLDDQAAYEEYVDATGEDDIEAFKEAYLGEFDSEKAFAEHVVEECGILSQIPEHLQQYFDYDAYARHLFDDYTFSNGYVFSH